MSMKTGTIFTSLIQYLAYADDITLIGKKSKDIAKAYIELETAAHKAGLTVIDSKTQCMILQRNEKEGEKKHSKSVIEHLKEQKTFYWRHLGQ